MTDASIGVSVSLPLNYKNINLIIKILGADHITLYISGLFDETDEVINCDFDDTFDLDTLDELLDLNDEDEFKKKYNELDIKDGLIFHFMYICAGIYARNLSYRSHPYLFHNDETDMTPIKLIEYIQKGIDIFKGFSIPEELIKIGNTIFEG